MVIDGENGFVCERKDPNSLAVALEKLINDSTLCRQMGERGYQRYKEEYTLEAFERKFIETMHKCLYETVK
jgi:glycosyltransferase involved in cell wall biosynthesis